MYAIGRKIIFSTQTQEGNQEGEKLHQVLAHPYYAVCIPNMPFSALQKYQ
jgi:hypothetical protein